MGEGYTYEPHKLIDNARALRRNSTDAEQILWSILRDRQLNGYKFRRQHPIEKYVLDFYCDSAKLAIELDGGQHAEQQTYDETRTKFLEMRGIKVLRFWNNDVLENLEGVFDTIEKALNDSTPSPNPLPEGEGFTSVHLAEFPNILEWPSEKVILNEMEYTRDICNAALAIRNKINIRVRQPLQQIKLIGKTSRGNMQDIILDEVNAKTFEVFIGSVEEFAALKLSIKSQVLGKRLPAMMKQILPASKKGEWKQVDGGVEICGEKLLPEEFTLQLEPKPEYADRAQALSSNDALVILDTTLTPELEAEGIARDVVRMVQQARKDAGFHVSDRIQLAVVAQGKAAQAVAEHQRYITEQTLAGSLENATFEDASFSASGNIEGDEITIFLKRIA
ncbi:MAG: DUF559 domain-containing protein [Alphaproteobacteria bacterium]|nr:DUF559 domain-containing protein [Alphaproteobacteria bacterium]